MHHVFLALGWMLVVTTLASAQQKPALPPGAVARLGVHRLRVPTSILDAAFTPDGRTFVVAFDAKDNRPNVILFDVASGLERKRLNIPGARHVAMARHKPVMAVDTCNGFETWDLAAEKCVQQWDYPECVDEATALAISPDGTQVVAGVRRDGLLRWNAATGEALAPVRPRPSPSPIRTLQFSDDGSKLLSAGVPVYADDGMQVAAVFEAVNTNLFFLSALSGPRTRLLHHTFWTIGSQWLKPAAQLVTVWDAKTGNKLTEFSNESGSCAFSPDGTMVALSVNNGSRIDIIRLNREWSHVGTIGQNGLFAYTPLDFDSFAFTPDGKHLLLAGRSGFVWDIAARKKVRDVDLPYATMTRFSQDGKLVAAVRSDDEHHPNNHAQFVDLTTGKPMRYTTGYADAIGGVAYSPDGRWLATFSQDTLFLHDAKTGAELRRITHKERIHHMAFSPDGKTLAANSGDSTINLWDPATGELRRRLTDKYPAKLVAFTGDGKALISVSSGGVVRRWDVADGKHVEVCQLPIPKEDAHNVAASGEYLAFFQANREIGNLELQWLRVRTGKNLPATGLHSFGQQTGNESLAFGAAGKLLATAGSAPKADDKYEAAVQVWESATQREIARFSSDRVPGLLAISPDGRMLAHGSALPQKKQDVPDTNPRPQDYFGTVPRPTSEQALLVRDLLSAPGIAKDDDRTLRHITGHLGHFTCLAFSPDGKFLATGGSDQVVYIWRVEHFFKPPALPEGKGDVAQFWPHLADPDPGKAYRAIAQLERKPKETLAFLRKHLQPAPLADDKVIVKHLRDLASANFTVRQQAEASLEKLGEQAEQPLRSALKKPANLEMKRRLETLLERLDRPMDVAHNIRAYRCLTLLERINTQESRQLLEELSRGAPTAWLTTEARYSLIRAR